MDPAGLAWHEGFLAEFEETVLARETLPTLRGNPGWIDSARGASTTVASRTVRTGAISRARYVQVSRQTHRCWFGCVRHEVGDVGVSAHRSRGSPACGAVGWSACVVDHVAPRGLETDSNRYTNTGLHVVYDACGPYNRSTRERTTRPGDAHSNNHHCTGYAA